MLATLLVGCDLAVPTPSPDFAVRLPGGVPGTPNILSIVDPSGVVVDAQVADDHPPLAEAAAQTSSLGNGQLLVAWEGGICESQPVLTIGASAGSLRLQLNHGPSPESCAAAGVEYAVVLQLDPSVNADRTEIEEAWPSSSASPDS